MIVDAAIVAFTGFFTWRGWKRGIVGPLIRLVGFVAAVVAAILGYGTVAEPLRDLGVSNGIAYIAAALLIFVGVTASAWAAARAMTKLVNFTAWGLVNRGAGAALGAAWALAWVAVVLAGVRLAPAGEVHEKLEASVLAEAIAREAPELAGAAARADLRRLVTALLN